MMTPEEAQRLWDSLKALLTDTREAIQEIIKTRAWEPLGFKTFSDAWKANMSEIELARELRPYVVYQLLSEGRSTDDVADAVKGVGPETAEELDRQRRNGVPAEFAVVRKHFRRKPCQPDTIHLKIGKTMLAEYQRISAVVGAGVEDIAKEAISQRFAELARASNRERSA